jgi:hypothetical protein
MAFAVIRRFFSGVEFSSLVIGYLLDLDHFRPRPIRRISVIEGDSLSIACEQPNGVPEPSIFWIYRDNRQPSVMETIKKPHITTASDGTLHFSFVEKNDARAHLMYQCAAKSPVLHGDEYRLGEQVQLDLIHENSTSKIGKIFKRSLNFCSKCIEEQSKVHLLWSSTSTVSVVAGKKLKLMCIFGGR